jgi:nitroreductase
MAQSENYNIFYSAPLVIIVSGPANYSMIESDCAAAIQNMLLAAESLGYGGCWINFVLFAFHGLNANLGRLRLPEGYRPFGSVAIGLKDDEYPGERNIKGNTVNYL